MLLSMTGFGRGEAVLDDTKITTEVVGLNHRFLDVSIRLPCALCSLETDLRRKLKKRLARGRVTVTVELMSTTASLALPTMIDAELAHRYADRLRALADQMHLVDDISVMGVINMPGVTNAASESVDANRLAPAVAESLDTALDRFDEVRATEGAALRADLELRISRVGEKAEAVHKRIPAVVEAYRERLDGRIRELGELNLVDPERVALEVAMFADKCDVSEEVVRLRSHVEQFLEILNGDKSAGRLLDFLCQEMHREITTIGGKGRDSDVSHLVVEVKGEIEKVREQVQNIE